MNTPEESKGVHFIDQLIAIGFKDDSKSCGYKYNKNDGWLGCTASHPDIRFENKEFLIDISLQGISTPCPENKQEIELFKNRAVRYIGVFKKPYKNKFQHPLYKTLTGIIPDISILKINT